MRRLNLTEVIVILMLMCYSRGLEWEIYTTRSINVTKGSDSTINCTFKYPSDHQVKEVYWKVTGYSECSKGDKDTNAFVFHPNSSCVLTKYKNKTKLIGDKAKGNCTLKVFNIQDSNTIYMRVVTDKDKWSFKKKVSISVDDMTQTVQSDLQEYTTVPFEHTVGRPSDLSAPSFHGNTNMYLMIFIPVAALLTIAVAGTVAYVRRRRVHPPTSHPLTPGDKHQLPDNLNTTKSHSFNRKESGYYVNFSRAPTNPPTRGASCKSFDKKPTEEEAIDEPVYINLQTETNQPNQDMEHADGIYANVDYSSLR